MKISVCISCLLISFVLLAPAHTWAQEKQHLTPVNYQKIAFVDGDRLHQEYREYTVAREKMHKEFVEKKKSFDEATRVLDQQTNKQLKNDSIHKLQQKQQISDKAAASRATLQSAYMAGLKQRSEDRKTLIKNYENKIREAVQAVMREGAFTELRSKKDDAGSTAIDITDKVLQKLNQNQ